MPVLRRQLRDDFLHDLPPFLNFLRLERNRADHRMAAAAIALANLRDVVGARARRPGIGTHGNLGARGTARQGDRLGRLRIEIIRNDVVEALEALID